MADMTHHPGTVRLDQDALTDILNRPITQAA